MPVSRSNDDLSAEAWEQSLEDVRKEKFEKLTAAAARTSLTAAALLFYHKYYVPRGHKPLSGRGTAHALLPTGGLPKDLADLVDSAIRAAYHEAADPGTPAHASAAASLRQSLTRLKRDLHLS